VNLFSLANRRALVAGASRGIGLAIARLAAEAGAETILAARSLDALEQESAALRERGFRATALPLDMTDRLSIARAAEAAGDVDILINVAGTNVRKPFADYSLEEYGRLMQTNLHSVFELTQLVGRRMVERGQGGKIINIASLASAFGLPYLTVYAMTKSGLAGMTRALAAEWGRHDIQVNAICPGFIITDLNRQMWQPEPMREWLRGVEANPRPGTPDDIAPLAVFLAGAGANYITGQLIFADGGYSSTAVWPFEPQ
jgi:gluconate 5-dehydrogenase